MSADKIGLNTEWPELCVLESVLRNFRTSNSIDFSVDISLAAGDPIPPI